MSALAVAVDIGGTFTDVTLQDPATGRAWRVKTPSVPSDPSQAFLVGVTLALEQAGREAMDVTRVLHGTTVATNMILEGKGARTALVTTAGFRHVLEIGRQDIPRRVNLYAWVKPKRPVPASRVLEVRERVAAGGAVLEPLDEASVQVAAEALLGMKVDAVAVCLLHAFANPAHERRVAELLRQALPGVAVTASSDVLPVVREYERSLATILNAQVMPGVATYVRRLEQRLEHAHHQRRIDLAGLRQGTAELSLEIGGEQSFGAQHARCRRDQHAADVEQRRQRAAMQRPRAAKGDQREVAGIVTALDRDDADCADHVVVEDGEHATRGLIQ